MDKKIIHTVLLISSIAVSGCSTVNQAQNDKSVSSKPRLTVADVMKRQGGNTDITSYRKSVSNSSNRPYKESSRPINSRRSSDATLKHYTRSEAKELKGIFPRLPNPDLCMYVYPHLSLEDSTIPGYTSCFSMYDKNHYALPGELPATTQANY